MRTDGVSLSAEAVDSLRATISSRYVMAGTTTALC